MALITLDTKNLAALDGGRLAKSLEQELEKAVKDCVDRPADRKPRKVTLQIELVPDAPDHTGDVEGVNLKYKCRAMLPVLQSRNLNMGVKKDGKLYVNEHAPDNHQQGTFPALDDEQTTTETAE